MKKGKDGKNNQVLIYELFQAKLFVLRMTRNSNRIFVGVILFYNIFKAYKRAKNKSLNIGILLLPFLTKR